MIRQNRDETTLKGSKSLIYCEFSTLVLSLLDRGYSKEKLQSGFNEAVEWKNGFDKRVMKKIDNNTTIENIIDKLSEEIAKEIVGELIGGNEDENN